VAVLPITDAHAPYAERVAGRLRQARVRVEVDGRPERVGRKIAEAQARRVPFMAVVGGREAEAGTVQVRSRTGEQSSEPLDDFAQRVALEIAERR